MEQDIFQVFFDVMDVCGVGIIDSQTQLEFYVKGHTLTSNEKQEIVRDIVQIVTSKLEQFDFFEFPFMSYYAYIYKLNHNSHILILTQRLAIKQLKDAVLKDIENALLEFKVLVKNIPEFTSKIKVTVEDLLTALNHLSQFISKYMGNKLTANYWELTRPHAEWLKNFQINHSAKIAFSAISTEPVSALQHQWIKQWTAAFINRCAQTLKNLPALIEDKCLDENQKAILLGYSASSLPKLEDGIAV
jgi:hypothetical protein